METKYSFVEELAFISDRLRQVFEKNTNDAAPGITFKEVQQFQKYIRSWNREFVKPPKLLIAACDLERLTDFYRHRLDFSIFQRFPPVDFETIKQEIAAYVAREALDALIGYRLRNWAAIGLYNPKWEIYQGLVHAYYEQTLSQERRVQILEFEKALVQTADLTAESIHKICVGELFFEIDRLRLMSLRKLTSHLEDIYQQEVERKPSPEKATQQLNVPDELRESFHFFGITHQIDFNELKYAYRQLALNYHPDKGGSLEMMQKLNAAYRQIADYLRQEEGV